MNERITLHHKESNHWTVTWWIAGASLLLDGLKILGQIATIIGTAFAVGCFVQTSAFMLTCFFVLSTLTLCKKIAEVMYRTELAPLQT